MAGEKLEELRKLMPPGIGLTAGQSYDYPESPYEILGLTEYQVTTIAALLRGMVRRGSQFGNTALDFEGEIEYIESLSKKAEEAARRESNVLRDPNDGY